MSLVLQVHGTGKRRPSLVEAAQQLKVSVNVLDAEFGVKVIDPWEHIYVVRSAAPELDSHEQAQDDPPIGVFGR